MSAAIVDHDVTVLCGDVREQLATLDAGSVQCVVTSPPYYGLRDYGVEGQLGLEDSPAEYVAAMVDVFREVRRVLADDGVLWLNLGDSYSTADVHSTNAHNANRAGTGDPKSEAMAAAMGSRRRRPPLPTKNLMGIPWRLAFALQDDGWTLRNDVIWHKPNAMPESVTDRLSTRHEHLFLLSKSRRYWFDLDAIREPVVTARADALTFDREEAKTPPGQRPQHRPGRAGGTNLRPTGRQHLLTGTKDRNPGDVWTITTVPFPGAHFACFPPELPRRCILAGCPEGGTVLDPFAGSGTTLMVARQLARKAVGIELNPAYVEIIRKRIGQEPFDFGAVS